MTHETKQELFMEAKLKIVDIGNQKAIPFLKACAINLIEMTESDIPPEMIIKLHGVELKITLSSIS